MASDGPKVTLPHKRDTISQKGIVEDDQPVRVFSVFLQHFLEGLRYHVGPFNHQQEHIVIGVLGVLGETLEMFFA